LVTIKAVEFFPALYSMLKHSFALTMVASRNKRMCKSWEREKWFRNLFLDL